MVNFEILQRPASLAAPAVASGKTWAPGALGPASLATYSSKFTKFTKFTESPQLGVLIRPNYFRSEL